MQRTMSLGELMDAVLEELNQKQYSVKTIKQYERFFRQIKAIAETEGYASFSKELGETYLRIQFNYPNENHGEVRGGRRAVDALAYFTDNACLKKRFTVLPEERDCYRVILDKYRHHLLGRNIALGTVNLHLKGVRRFLEYLSIRQVFTIRDITREHVSGYILTLRAFSKETVRSRLYSLRSFLRFANGEGFHERSLETLIPRLCCPRAEKMVATWSAEETERIISAADRGSPTGKRDYAILLLAARLGMRSSDIISLHLSDIVWEQNKIVFDQAKTGAANTLPLSEEIGIAIVDYLQNGRPKQSSSALVFTRHLAPYDALQSIYAIVDKHIRLSGVDLKGRKHGAHTFRHSLVCRLLEKSVPYPVISEILGHSSANATKSYTHIDINQLRSCALDPDSVVNYA